MALTKVTSALTNLDGGITIDNITIDGTEIDLSSGSLTIDVADNIVLDTDGGNIALKDNGTQFGNFANNGGDFEIDSNVQDKDIKFNGNDGGSTITAGFFDMSDGGKLQIGASSVANLNMGRNGDVIEIKAKKDGTDAINLTFHTQASGGTTAERVRVTSAGVLCVGKTSDDSTSEGIWLRKHPVSGHGQIMCAGSGSSAYEGLYVRDISNSELEFYASYHGTIGYRTLYNMSDERKKDNIQDITLGLNAIKELRPVSFDWKNDKGDNQLGFIAQEVETTSLKQLVGEWKDENIEDCKSLNKEQMIPVLVKAIQELSAKVEELESKINE